MQDLVSVRDAASRLEVSVGHVYRLLESGELRGPRIGSQQTVLAASLQEYRLVRPRPGRPLGPSAAWARLLAAHPETVEDLGALAAATRRRADVLYCHALEFRLVEIEDAPATVLTGAGGAHRHSVPVGSTKPLQTYLRQDAWPAFRAEQRIEESAEEMNVIVRLVPDDAWPFQDEQRVAPLVVCATDAYAVGDLRSAHESLVAIGHPG